MGKIETEEEGEKEKVIETAKVVQAAQAVLTEEELGRMKVGK
jgi:hypothetical protein